MVLRGISTCMENEGLKTGLMTWPLRGAGWRRILAALAGTLAWLSAAAAEWHVSATAGAGGAGTRENPWRLDVALAHPPQVQPGDVIWVHGGTYTGLFKSRLTGTASLPIIVRQWPGDRATIDGASLANLHATLAITGSYTWYWGLEVMSSDTDRVSNEPGSGPSAKELPRRHGIELDQSGVGTTGIKFINMIIHDTRQGFSLWKNSSDVEVYGCLIFNNGWSGPDRGHGHGIYVQNETGSKWIRDNIIFNQFDTGIHGYGSSAAPLDNIVCERNIVFGNGLPFDGYEQKQILLGGGRIALNPVVDSNWLFARAGTLLRLGYEAGTKNARVSGNYLGPAGSVIFSSPEGLTLEDNEIYTDSVYGVKTSDYPGNVFAKTPPKNSWGRLIVNSYDPARANVVVYNWNNATDVEIDASAFLAPGDVFELRNALNYFNDVERGTNSTGRIRVRMASRTVAAPIGRATPPSPFPTFGAFVLIKEGSVSEAPKAPDNEWTKVIEAESASLQPGLMVRTDVAASNGLYVETAVQESGSVSFKVTIPESGDYVIWCRVRGPDPDSDSFYVSTDEHGEDVFDVAEGSWKSSWQWAQLNGRAGGAPLTVNPRVFRFSTGVHTIHFRGREAGAGLDQIFVTRLGAGVPPLAPEALRAGLVQGP
jgi:hypothetical protein